MQVRSKQALAARLAVVMTAAAPYVASAQSSTPQCFCIVDSGTVYTACTKNAAGGRNSYSCCAPTWPIKVQQEVLMRDERPMTLLVDGQPGCGKCKEVCSQPGIAAPPTIAGDPKLPSGPSGNPVGFQLPGLNAKGPPGPSG